LNEFCLSEEAQKERQKWRERGGDIDIEIGREGEKEEDIMLINLSAKR